MPSVKKAFSFHIVFIALLFFSNRHIDHDGHEQPNNECVSMRHLIGGTCQFSYQYKKVHYDWR